MFEELFVGSTY